MGDKNSQKELSSRVTRSAANPKTVRIVDEVLEGEKVEKQKTTSKKKTGRTSLRAKGTKVSIETRDGEVAEDASIPPEMIQSLTELLLTSQKKSREVGRTPMSPSANESEGLDFSGPMTPEFGRFEIRSIKANLNKNEVGVKEQELRHDERNGGSPQEEKMMMQKEIDALKAEIEAMTGERRRIDEQLQVKRFEEKRVERRSKGKGTEKKEEKMGMSAETKDYLEFENIELEGKPKGVMPNSAYGEVHDKGVGEGSTSSADEMLEFINNKLSGGNDAKGVRLSEKATALGMEGNPLWQGELGESYNKFRSQWGMVESKGWPTPEALLVHARAGGLLFQDTCGILYVLKFPDGKETGGGKQQGYDYSNSAKLLANLKAQNPDKHPTIERLHEEVSRGAAFHAPFNLDLLWHFLDNQMVLSAQGMSLLDVAKEKMLPSVESGGRVRQWQELKRNTLRLVQRLGGKDGEFSEHAHRLTIEISVVTYVMARVGVALVKRDLRHLNDTFIRDWDQHFSYNAEPMDVEDRRKAFKVAIHLQGYSCSKCGTFGSTGLWCLSPAKTCSFVEGAKEGDAKGGTMLVNPEWTKMIPIMEEWGLKQSPIIPANPRDSLKRAYNSFRLKANPTWKFPNRDLVAGGKGKSTPTHESMSDPFKLYVERQHEVKPHAKEVTWWSVSPGWAA
jgi:hypothetical protein